MLRIPRIYDEDVSGFGEVLLGLLARLSIPVEYRLKYPNVLEPRCARIRIVLNPLIEGLPNTGLSL